MNKVRLDYIVRPRAVPRESGRVMLFRPFALVIDMRHCAHGDPEDAVGGRGDPSGLHLPAGAREIQKRQCVIVPGADDEGNLVPLLKIVEFYGQCGKPVERANGVRSEREIPDLEFVCVLLKRLVERHEKF